MSGETGSRQRGVTSRGIDRVTNTLGHEAAFVVVGVLAAGACVVAVAIGPGVRGLVTTVSLVISLVTLVMVFAIQHTSSREARALNVKLDELIRVSEARNELIGAEDESHVQLNERRGQLLAERRRTVD